MKYPKQIIAEKKDHFYEIHGLKINDPLHWLREKENPSVEALIDCENQFTKEFLKPTEKLQEQIYKEIRGRIKEEDQDVPVKIGNYWYYNRSETNKEYAIHCRRGLDINSPEQIILDENILAKNLEYFELGSLALSPDHKKIAFTTDTKGDEIYQLTVKDLDSEKTIFSFESNLSGGLEWYEDNESLLLVDMNEELRPNSCFSLNIHTKLRKDIYVEDDPEHFVSISKTKNDKYLFIESHGKITSEYHFSSSKDASALFVCFQKREKGHEYYVGAHQDSFYILSNISSKEFEIFKCEHTKTDSKSWSCWIENNEGETFIDDFEVFHDFICVSEREKGLDHLRLVSIDKSTNYRIPMDHDCYELDSELNPNYNTDYFRFEFSALNQPESIYEIEFLSKKTKLLKQIKIPGDYNSDNYIIKRGHAPSHDGIEVPVSYVFHKDHPPSENTPVYLYAYGSYGETIECGFRRSFLSLLDRGITVAIAHPRGGSIYGQKWYEEGKYLKKKNTFYDVNSVAKYFINSKLCDPNRIYLSGGSAGGLMVGACLNLEPKLYSKAVANVPFVDVVNTMLDSSQALTALEYEEWGNPNNKEYFDYIRSYSPYENVEQNSYPAVLAISGWHDKRVFFWEATKWIQQLRENQMGTSPILLYTNKGSGHGGSSGRFEAIREIAMEFAFFIADDYLIDS
ncbi:MAG: S9 family peptidase [Bdellovibrionales bacterium]